MRIAKGSVGLWTVCLIGGLELADVSAQVVQLPSYRTFGMGTSVLVPDHGAVMLGGIHSARSGQQASGWPWPSSRRFERARQPHGTGPCDDSGPARVGCCRAG